MTPNQVIKHFGSENKAALNLDITRQCIYIWNQKGEIPLWSQYAIAWKTNGVLKPSDAKQKKVEK